MNPTVQFLEIVMDNPQKMFNDEIKKLDIKHNNEMDQYVFKKIGMKQNDLGSYFKKKTVVYEEEEENKNVYSEGENKNVYSEGDASSGDEKSSSDSE